jgi:Fur family transcriptional regulator, ferric uptake regulator
MRETVSVATPSTTEPDQAVRSTRQGRAIEQVLDDADVFLSAQEIHARLRAAGGGVGLATVYRHLQRLSDSGLVDVIKGNDDQLVYRRCGSARHHHHLVCRSCRRSDELESTEVEQWAAAQASGHGYSDVEHTVEIFGVCPDCRTSANRATS